MKKGFKQLFALGLIGVMTISLAGCGSKSGGSADPTKTPTKAPSSSGDNSQGADNTTPADPNAIGLDKYDYKGVTVLADLEGLVDESTGAEMTPSDLAAKELVEAKYNIVLKKPAMEGYDGTNLADVLISSIAAGKPATHILGGNPDGMISLFTNNLLFDITDYVDELKIASLYAKTITSWNGRSMGFSYNNLGPNWYMGYNRDLLKQIGMEKTPTDMFMEGKWDYASFKAYLVEMKSKLPEGTYPVGFYPYHWAVMAASANGGNIIGPNQELNLTSEAVVEAISFYQELINEGLAYPATGSDNVVYKIDDERIVLGRKEDWNTYDFDWGFCLMPWGSQVTATGDYTTLSENYKVAQCYFGYTAVLASAPDATGIPGEILTQIAKDYYYAKDPAVQIRMDEEYNAEKEGRAVDLTTKTSGGEFNTAQDGELARWAYSRFYGDLSWAFDRAELVETWKVFEDIFWLRQDVRSTLEAYQQEGEAKLRDAGILK